MYKVNHRDVIPTRTTEEAFEVSHTLIYNSKERQVKLEKTWNTLGKHFTKGTSINAIVRTAYRFVDLQMENMAKLSVCAKGCSHCCRLDVTLTTLEAAYIENNTEYKVVIGNANRKKMTNDEYCPFHDSQTATCKIYEFRPLSCRWFFSMDSHKYCEDPKTSHAISANNGVPDNALLKDLSMYMRQASGAPLKDIRQFFSHIKGASLGG